MSQTSSDPSYLTPRGGGQESVTLGAKNIRAELKAAGIKAFVRIQRYAGGSSIYVYYLDEGQPAPNFDRYQTRSFNAWDDSTSYINQEWTNKYGGASGVSVCAASGEDEQKLRGTYIAPPKKELTIEEIEKRFLTGARNGTESVVAKWLPTIQERSNKATVKAAWILAIQARGRNAGAMWALADNADPNVEVFGRTPLHFAAGDRAMEMTQLLLDKGADPFALDDRGKQPRSSDPAVQGLLDSARKRIELKALAETRTQEAAASNTEEEARPRGRFM